MPEHATVAISPLNASSKNVVIHSAGSELGSMSVLKASSHVAIQNHQPDL